MSRPTETLGSRARRGAVFTVAGHASGYVLRFASSLILTRLLFEEAFGLMSIVHALLTGLTLFSDVGIGPSIVQNERSDSRFLGTAFAVQVARGMLLTLAAALLAWPCARLYGHDELLWLIPVVGLNAGISGLNSTKLFVLQREVAIGRVTLVNLVSQLASFGTMLIWSLLYPSVWALVGGALVSSVTQMLLSQLLLPGPMDRFAWDREALKSLLRFGRWIFLSTALTFLTGQSIDRLVFGRLIPLDALGVYHVAATLAAIPLGLLSALADQVIFPVLSKVQRSGKPLGLIFRRTRLPVQVAAGWAFSGLIAGGPTALRVLYDERWWDGGWVIQLIGASSWFSVCATTQRAVLAARGEVHMLALGSGIKLLAMGMCISVGFAHFGFFGAVAGFALSEVFRYLAMSWAVSRMGLDALRHDLVFSVWIGVVGLVVWQGALYARSVGVPLHIEASLVTFAVTVAWLPLAWRPAIDLVRARGEDPTLASAAIGGGVPSK
ncbi:MAG: oligosaccharide flippase family protein [Proteobacteria bacterium]|nr:oligosaccharide flippase family protein [Pseudomonadota bacterium]